MFRNRWIRTVAAFALLGGAMLIHFAAWSARPGITTSNFARIEIGMTQAQVEEILGAPPNYVAPNGRNWMGLLLT